MKQADTARQDEEGEKKKKKKDKKITERSSTIEANPENLIQKKVGTGPWHCRHACRAYWACEDQVLTWRVCAA